VRIDRAEREFEVAGVRLTHVADVSLEPDELVTFEGGLDVTRKDWGYYATPSLNGRLREHGLRAVLVLGGGKLYLLLVEEGAEPAFEDYLREQELRVVAWLDSDEAVRRFE
jgi:hypothetical protein